jgi:hypothetical protein
MTELLLCLMLLTPIYTVMIQEDNPVFTSKANKLLLENPISQYILACRLVAGNDNLSSLL